MKPIQGIPSRIKVQPKSTQRFASQVQMRFAGNTAPASDAPKPDASSKPEAEDKKSCFSMLNPFNWNWKFWKSKKAAADESTPPAASPTTPATTGTNQPNPSANTLPGEAPATPDDKAGRSAQLAGGAGLPPGGSNRTETVYRPEILIPKVVTADNFAAAYGYMISDWEAGEDLLNTKATVDDGERHNREQRSIARRRILASQDAGKLEREIRQIEDIVYNGDPANESLEKDVAPNDVPMRKVGDENRAYTPEQRYLQLLQAKLYCVRTATTPAQPEIRYEGGGLSIMGGKEPWTFKPEWVEHLFQINGKKIETDGQTDRYDKALTDGEINLAIERFQKLLDLYARYQATAAVDRHPQLIRGMDNYMLATGIRLLSHDSALERGMSGLKIENPITASRGMPGIRGLMNALIGMSDADFVAPTTNPTALTHEIENRQFFHEYGTASGDTSFTTVERAEGGLTLVTKGDGALFGILSKTDNVIKFFLGAGKENKNFKITGLESVSPDALYNIHLLIPDEQFPDGTEIQVDFMDDQGQPTRSTPVKLIRRHQRIELIDRSAQSGIRPTH